MFSSTFEHNNLGGEKLTRGGVGRGGCRGSSPPKPLIITDSPGLVRWPKISQPLKVSRVEGGSKQRFPGAHGRPPEITALEWEVSSEWWQKRMLLSFRGWELSGKSNSLEMVMLVVSRIYNKLLITPSKICSHVL